MLTFANHALFVVTFLFIYSLMSAVSYARTGARVGGLRRRIDGLIDADAPAGAAGGDIMDDSLYGRAVRPVLARYKTRASTMLGNRSMGSIQTMITNAGLTGSMSAEEFAAGKVVAAVVFGVGAGLLALAGGRFNLIALYMALGALVGWLGPDYWLRSKLRMRQEAISTELGQWIPSLRTACIAGANIEAAIADLVKETRGVLAAEFSVVDKEVRHGEPLNISLRRMTERNGNSDLTMMVETILTTSELGTNVAHLLAQVSDEMKKRARSAKMELVKKAPVKMLFPTLFLIFPATFLIMMGPTIPRFFSAF